MKPDAGQGYGDEARGLPREGGEQRARRAAEGGAQRHVFNLIEIDDKHYAYLRRLSSDQLNSAVVLAVNWRSLRAWGVHVCSESGYRDVTAMVCECAGREAECVLGVLRKEDEDGRAKFAALLLLGTAPKSVISSAAEDAKQI